MKNRVILCVILLISLVGCARSDQYKPAGFTDYSEVWPYWDYSYYYSKRLSTQEWQTFFDKFPDLYRDHLASGVVAVSPETAAYAFRWTTLQRKEKWDPSVIARLEKHDTQPGDDIFQVIYAIGPAEHIIWDKGVEVLTDATGMIRQKIGTMKIVKSLPDLVLNGRNTNFDNCPLAR